MRRTYQIRLAMLLMCLLTGLALSSTATAQSSTTAFAGTSPTTRAVTDGDDCAETTRRLDKTLDAYEKAMAKIQTDADLIQAHVALENLLKEYIAVKDQMIADLTADNAFLRKKASGNKSKLRQVLEHIEKVLIFGAGIYLGAH